MNWGAMGKSLAEIVVASAGMGVFLYLFQQWFPIMDTSVLVGRVFRLILALVGGGFLYLIFLKGLRNPEMNYILETLKKRRR